MKWPIWRVLNRQRTGVGRSKSNLCEWRYIENDLSANIGSYTNNAPSIWMPQLACEYFKSQRTLYSEPWSGGTSQVLASNVMIFGLPGHEEYFSSCNDLLNNQSTELTENIVSFRTNRYRSQMSYHTKTRFRKITTFYVIFFVFFFKKPYKIVNFLEYMLKILKSLFF